MFKAKQRLTKNNDINFVYKNGKFLSLNNIVVKLVYKNRDYSRTAIIISKKISKKAVVRNKLKRQIKSIIRPLIPSLRHCDLIVVCQPALVKCNYQDIQKSLVEIFQKLVIK